MKNGIELKTISLRFLHGVVLFALGARAVPLQNTTTGPRVGGEQRDAPGPEQLRKGMLGRGASALGLSSLHGQGTVTWSIA